MAPPNPQRNRKYNLSISLERRKIRNIWQRALITGMPIPSLATYHLGILLSLKEMGVLLFKGQKEARNCCPGLKENDRICLCQVMERVTERKLRIHIRLYIYYFYSWWRLVLFSSILFFNTFTTLILENCICQAKLIFAVVTSNPQISGTDCNKNLLLIHATSPL